MLLIHIYTSQSRATGVSGQAGANARVDVEDLRREGGFVTTLHLVMEVRTVPGNSLRARRETARNVRILMMMMMMPEILFKVRCSYC